MDCSMCKFFHNELDEEPCIKCSNNYTSQFQPVSISHKLNRLLNDVGSNHNENLRITNVSAVVGADYDLKEIQEYAEDCGLEYLYNELYSDITIKDVRGIRYSFTKRSS